MTKDHLRRLSCANIEALAKRALLLDEVFHACEESGHWNLANIVEEELDELTKFRRRVHFAHQTAFGQ